MISITGSLPRSPLRRRVAAALVAAAALCAETGALCAASTVLAGPGSTIQLRAGTRGELFPGTASGAAAQHPVLALEQRSGGQVARHLVPGSEGPEQEGLAELVLEPDSQRVFVLWSDQAAEPASASRLQLAAFAAGVFAPTIEISGDPLSRKTPVRLAITRDAYEVPESGEREAASHTRTVAHVVWHEVTEIRRTFYTPLVFQQGAFLGWNPVVLLDSLDEAFDGASSEGPSSSQLFKSFALDSGADDRSAILLLPLESTRALLTVRLRVLPYSLLVLADDARSHIIGVGQRSTGGGILSLAEEARSHIIGVGAKLHSGVVGYIAEQSYLDVLEHGAEFDQYDLPVIASRLWDRVVTSGASITGASLVPEELPCSVLHLGASPEVGTQPLHQVELCLIARYDAPATEIASPPSLFVSEDGARVVVAWQREGALRFVRGDASGWGDEQNLPADLPLEQALAVVRALARP